DQRDLDTEVLQRAQQAVGIAKDVLTADDVVALAQQSEKHRSQRRHAGGKGYGVEPVFHLGDLGFERRRGRRSLSRIRKPGATLEYRDQVFRLLESILRRWMDGFVYGPAFGTEAPVGMERGGGEAVGRHNIDTGMCRFRKGGKNGPQGFRRPEIRWRR